MDYAKDLVYTFWSMLIASPGVFASIGLLFAVFIWAAFSRRPQTKREFYMAPTVKALHGGMALSADWMSISTFLSVAGIISLWGYDGMVLLLGWTGGFVLVTIIAPYLRKYICMQEHGVTLAAFLSDRFDSRKIRVVAVIITLFVSFIYVVGQMKGLGVIAEHFLPLSLPESDPNFKEYVKYVPHIGILLGMIVVPLIVINGIRAITLTQMLQCFLIVFIYTFLAVILSSQFGFFPQATFIEAVSNLNNLQQKFGFPNYETPFTHISMWNMFFILTTLIGGTAGLPHVLIRLYTAKSVKDARWTGLYALLFIGIVYTAIPIVAVVSRASILKAIDNGLRPSEANYLDHFNNEDNDFIYYKCEIDNRDHSRQLQNFVGVERQVCDQINQTIEKNADIIPDRVILANTELLFGENSTTIKRLFKVVIVIGALSALLSTTSILMYVIVTSIAHDVHKLFRDFFPIKGEKDTDELRLFSVLVFVFVIIASVLGIRFFEEPISGIVSISFNLACASLFPTIILAIFDKRMNEAGAFWGMLSGFGFTGFYILSNTLLSQDSNWFLGIPNLGIGAIGMVIHFIIAFAVSSKTSEPSERTIKFVEFIRNPIEENSKISE